MSESPESQTAPKFVLPEEPPSDSNGTPEEPSYMRPCRELEDRLDDLGQTLDQTLLAMGEVVEELRKCQERSGFNRKAGLSRAAGDYLASVRATILVAGFGKKAE